MVKRIQMKKNYTLVINSTALHQSSDIIFFLLYAYYPCNPIASYEIDVIVLPLLLW